MNTDLYDLQERLIALAGSPFVLKCASAFAYSTFILCCAWLLTSSQRRWTAAIRHRIWFLSLCSIAIAPVFAALLPAIPLRIVPQPERVASATANPLAYKNQEVVSDNASSEVFALSTTDSPRARIDDTAIDRAQVSRGEVPMDQADTRSSDAPGREPEGALNYDNLTATTRVSDRSSAPWMTFFVIVWGIGLVVVVSPLVLCAFANQKLVESSTQVEVGEWASAVKRWSRKLGIKRKIRLLFSDRVSIPMIWGISRPVLAIPVEGARWSSTTRRVVCLHELSHIKRQDVLFQAIARVICGIYWFHPLAWFALRRMRIERELACDDCVLAQGEKPTVYAAQLVFFARAQLNSLNAMTAAMATVSSLSRRVSHALDTKPSRRPLSLAMARTMLGVAVLGTLCLASLKVGYQTAKSRDSESQGNLANLAPATGGDIFSGVVVDSKGHPISDAQILAIHTTTRVRGWHESHQVVSEATTNIDGEFELAVPEKIMAQMGDNGELQDSIQLVAIADEHVPDWQTVHHLFEGVHQSDLRFTLLTEPRSITGRIIDQEGNPVPELSVRVVGMSKAGSSEDVQRWHGLAQENPSQTSSPSSAQANAARIHYFPFIERVQTIGFPGLEPRSTTDSEGRFRIEGLGRDRLVDLEIEGIGFARTRLAVSTNEMEPVAYPTGDPRYGSKICYGPTFEYAIERDQPIVGVVRDQDTGMPIRGIRVSVTSFGSESLSINDFVEVDSDDEGRFVLRGIPRPNDDENPVSIEITPGVNDPYFPIGRFDVPRAGASSDSGFEVLLKKASWLRGQLVDDSSGEGIPGHVCYSPELENEYVDEYSSFQPGRFNLFPSGLVPTDENGRFRIPVIPGEGVLLALASEAAKYEAGHTEDGSELPRGRDLQPYKYFQVFSGDWLNAAKTVDLEDSSELEDVLLRLVPRNKTQVQLMDENRKPLQGVRVIGEYSSSILAPQQRINSTRPSPTDEIQLYGLAESGERMVACLHTERNLGKVSIVEADGEREIVLEECSTIRGHVADWSPDVSTRSVVTAYVPDSSIPFSKEDAYHSSLFVSEATIGSDGSFEITGILPGSDYVLRIQGKSFPVRTSDQPNETLIIGPGENIDMGTVHLTDDSNEADDHR